MMKRASALLLLVSLSLGLSLGVNADQGFRADQTFGAPMPEAGDALSLGEAIAAIEAGDASFIKVRGQVTEVCQAKGCWMILVDGDSYARITFEDYGFFVPIETSMQQSVVYGILSEHVLSGEQAAHFAADAGAQSTLALTGEVREYSILARSVQLQGR